MTTFQIIATIAGCFGLIATIVIIALETLQARQDRLDDLSYRARFASPLNGDPLPQSILKLLHDANSIRTKG